jgi:hypothetical protein
MLKLIIRLSYIATMFIEALIIGRIVLIVIDANIQNNLAGWIMNTSSLVVDPFEGIVTNALEINNFELPVTPLIALVFFIIAGFILSELLKSFSRE